VKTILPDPLMFRRKNAHVSSYLDYILDYKLVRMTYDFLPFGWNANPAFGRDQRVFAVYGGYDCTLAFLSSCHRVLWGAAAAGGTNARPSDRDFQYQTTFTGANLLSQNALTLASVAPFYETYEMYNPSTVGIYVTIPYVVKWQRNWQAISSQDLAAQFATQYNTSCEQVQVSATGTPALRTMLYRGSALDVLGLVQTYGPGALDPLNVNAENTYRLIRKKWRWYLPPGKTCKFRIRWQGIRKSYALQFGAQGTYRYGDYALVVMAKPDLAVVSDTTTTIVDENQIVNFQQGIAIRRTSTSRSSVYSYIQGRVGFQSNQTRIDTALPNPPDVYVVNQPAATVQVATNAF